MAENANFVYLLHVFWVLCVMIKIIMVNLVQKSILY